MGGQGRKPIIPHVSPKRYRKRCALPKPLPLGEVALRSNDGEGKPVSREPLRSDGQAFCQSDTIRSVRAVWQQPCPLSRACARQLPQRGSPWHVGQLSSGRAKHNVSEAAVLRCLGQRQLDKERCPEAAVPVSKARPLAPYRASVVQWKVTRPAKASPLGRGVTEGDGEGKPGRKEPLRSDRQALCQSCLEAALPSQSRRKLLASSPKGGALGMSVRLSFVQPLSLLRRQLP